MELGIASQMSGGAGMMVELFSWDGEGYRAQAVYTDAKWEACKATRRSKNGGAIMSGPHFLRSLNFTQRMVPLSSGESELHACNRGGMEALGIVHTRRISARTSRSGIRQVETHRHQSTLVAGEGSDWRGHVEQDLPRVQDMTIHGLPWNSLTHPP